MTIIEETPLHDGAQTLEALSQDESHAILLAAARHCAADAERDLILADKRRDHPDALRLAGELDQFTRLETMLDAAAPARPRAA